MSTRDRKQVELQKHWIQHFRRDQVVLIVIPRLDSTDPRGGQWRERWRSSPLQSEDTQQCSHSETG
ncbi:hypothetical protein EYF80_012673 [Liparis tanakae]|uniref:Uncharacterized protein n=1 Tax=Liparis tanakae TaxID=230148 RepID=A0A4Z2IH69_9TELE|nr:hypothetical protein EYF80_012673 [Liparis tanakae]